MLDNYELPKAPIENQTSYRSEYAPRENTFSAIVRRNANETTIKKPLNEKISSETTNKDHFRSWNSNNSNETKTSGNLFFEYPSHAGEILFPSRERSFTTRTNSIHKIPKYSSKEDLVAKIPEKRDCIKQEGNLDLVTSYRDTFKKHPIESSKERKLPQSQNILSISDKMPMIGETQNKADFKFYADFQPTKPANCDPFVSDLDKQIYPGTL